MNQGDPANPAPADFVLHVSKGARGDVRWWLMLVVGLAFAYGGYSIDPARNCDSNGNCAPWLVPIALVLGVVTAMGGLAQLIINPGRGSYVDTDSRVLVWWLGRVRDGRSQDSGCVPLDAIARIKIVSNSDSADDVFLYDHQNQLLHFGGSEVIRWPAEKWAGQLAKYCNGLTVETS